MRSPLVEGGQTVSGDPWMADFRAELDDKQLGPPPGYLSLCRALPACYLLFALGGEAIQVL